MKQLPYILILVILLLAGGFYIDKTSKNKLLDLSPVSNTKSALIPAPEITGITNWLNLPTNKSSLNLRDLKGKVVLIDFWTYSCINCIRTLPFVTKWYETYKDKGLVIIGVHTPEFEFEKLTENVARATSRHSITYPVAQDNNYATWQAYQNKYWPAKYLIDQNGNIVYTHFGEGKYDITENAIKQLLKLNDSIGADTIRPTVKTEVAGMLGKVGSPEMYLGTNRIDNLSPRQSTNNTDFVFPKTINLNEFALEGKWTFTPEFVSCIENSCKLKLKFSAGKLYMVASSLISAQIKITVDNIQTPDKTITDSKLYTLFEGEYGEHELILEIKPSAIEKNPKSFLDIFTFTFG